MIENKDILILAVVGMPASGKSEAIEKLKKEFNFYHLYYGDITFDEINRMGIEINESNERIVREKFRQSGDMGIYSKYMIPKIEKAIEEGHTKIILESMYNIWEYEIIKEHFPESFKVLSVHSDSKIRLERIKKRKHRALNEEEFYSRQISEAKNLGKGSVIAIADFHIVNNGNNMERFISDLEDTFDSKLFLSRKSG
jgi:dephospho-CoA kinase